MTSEIFSLNLRDVGKALVTAFFSGVVISIAGVVTQSGFNIFQADWQNILGVALNGGIATFMGYIIKNFLSTPNGKFMGMIG